MISSGARASFFPFFLCKRHKTKLFHILNFYRMKKNHNNEKSEEDIRQTENGRLREIEEKISTEF